jgi:integrase/recombinase XerC
MASSAFDDAVDAYLRDCERRGLRPATLRYYRMVLGRFAALCAPMTPGDLSLASVRSFQDLSPRLSPGSVRGFLRALKTFSGWLTDEGLLPGDPLARLRMPRVDTRPRVMPTDQEVAAMLRTSRPTLRVVTALLLGTGIRISDAASLDADALRPGDLVVRHTKNRSGRVLPLDPVLETVLRRHREALLDTDGPLFRSRSGRALGADAVRHALTDARARVAIGVPVTPHVLRHWHARDLAAHDTTDRLLAARMGWHTAGLIARYAPVVAGIWMSASVVAGSMVDPPSSAPR